MIARSHRSLRSWVPWGMGGDVPEWAGDVKRGEGL